MNSRQPPNMKLKGKKDVNDRKKGKTKYDAFLPRNWDQAVKLDIANNNTLWQDAVEKEMMSLRGGGGSQLVCQIVTLVTLKSLMVVAHYVCLVLLCYSNISNLYRYIRVTDEYD